MYRLCVLFLFLVAAGFSQNQGRLTVNYENITPGAGSLYVALYNAEGAFLKQEFKGSVVKIENGKAQVIFDGLDYGEYAISSFVDENNNGLLDTNFFGMPKEPIAFSKNAKIRFGPPKFKDAKFLIDENEMEILITF